MATILQIKMLMKRPRRSTDVNSYRLILERNMSKPNGDISGYDRVSGTRLIFSPNITLKLDYIYEATMFNQSHRRQVIEGKHVSWAASSTWLCAWGIFQISSMEMEVKKGMAGLQALKRQVAIATKTHRTGHQIRGCYNEQWPHLWRCWLQSLVGGWTTHARLTETYSKKRPEILEVKQSWETWSSCHAWMERLL